MFRYRGIESSTSEYDDYSDAPGYDFDALCFFLGITDENGNRIIELNTYNDIKRLLAPKVDSFNEELKKIPEEIRGFDKNVLLCGYIASNCSVELLLQKFATGEYPSKIPGLIYLKQYIEQATRHEYKIETLKYFEGLSSDVIIRYNKMHNTMSDSQINYYFLENLPSDDEEIDGWAPELEDIFKLRLEIIGIGPNTSEIMWGMLSLGVPGKTGNECRKYWLEHVRAPKTVTYGSTIIRRPEGDPASLNSDASTNEDQQTSSDFSSDASVDEFMHYKNIISQSGFNSEASSDETAAMAYFKTVIKPPSIPTIGQQKMADRNKKTTSSRQTNAKTLAVKPPLVKQPEPKVNKETKTKKIEILEKKPFIIELPVSRSIKSEQKPTNTVKKPAKVDPPKVKATEKKKQEKKLPMVELNIRPPNENKEEEKMKQIENEVQTLSFTNRKKKEQNDKVDAIVARLFTHDMEPDNNILSTPPVSDPEDHPWPNMRNRKLIIPWEPFELPEEEVPDPRRHFFVPEDVLKALKPDESFPFYMFDDKKKSSKSRAKKTERLTPPRKLENGLSTSRQQEKLEKKKNKKNTEKPKTVEKHKAKLEEKSKDMDDQTNEEVTREDSHSPIEEDHVKIIRSQRGYKPMKPITNDVKYREGNMAVTCRACRLPIGRSETSSGVNNDKRLKLYKHFEYIQKELPKNEINEEEQREILDNLENPTKLLETNKRPRIHLRPNTPLFSAQEIVVHKVNDHRYYPLHPYYDAPNSSDSDDSDDIDINEFRFKSFYDNDGNFSGKLTKYKNTVDPITNKKMAHPTVDTEENCLDWCTWIAAIRKNRTNPITGKPLSKNMLTVLTDGNIINHEGRIKNVELW